MKKFPFYRQLEAKDCGPTCLKIVAKYYGKTLNIQNLRNFSETNRLGSSLQNLAKAAENLGFRSLGIRLELDKLKEIQLPCILHWNSNHYVVLYKIEKKKAGNRKVYFIADPASGLLKYDEENFIKSWSAGNSAADSEGIVLILEATPKFFMAAEQHNKELDFTFLLKYVKPYRKFIVQLVIGLTAASLLQLIAPFLTQSIVDVGVQNQNMHFIYLILIAQLFLFIGRTSLEFIRSWMLLNLSTRINISMISDFFIKLMNMPIGYFDVRITGDVLQKINDYNRVQRVLTNSSLTVFFSVLNLLISGTVLLIFNYQIFLIYLFGSVLFFMWIFLFLKRRKKLDNERFAEQKKEKDKIIELTNGMQDIKLHNAEQQKRWGWEYIQASLFRVSMKGLALEQTQNIGSNFINELKNIIITFFAAKLVIEGQLTFGMMVAISGLVGSLNAPILQLIGFIREIQDAKISLLRLSEIYTKKDESASYEGAIETIPANSSIRFKDISFRYPGSNFEVIKDLNLEIPHKKVTAIVGSSGSGKTTLMKLMMKFYSPTSGTIEIGKTSLNYISQKAWRNHIGAVLQEGFIFNDTVANNIALGVEIFDRERLYYAANVANIDNFVETLPQSYNTMLGAEGVGMSTGQKQRVFIARAVYKDPEILFFDEATSALDANNEKEIMEKLNIFFKHKTVVVIAHRLSTVMNADQIVVLEKGKIVEQGSHTELILLKGYYYNLVKNQLQLAS